MSFLVKTSDEILNQALRKLEKNTSLTATGPGSILRALTEVVTTEIADLYSVLDFNLSTQIVTTASGRALDMLGALYNVERKTISNLATIDRSLGSFYFYVDSPAPSNISIPAGTQVRTNTDDYLGNVFTYETTEVVVIPTGRLRAYATIRPLYADSIYTAGVNTLTQHNFENAPVGVTVKCKNVKPINPQTGYEDDDNYRARIIKSVRTTAGGTADALRFAGLALNGVRDVTVREAPFGLGTFDVLVVTDDNAGELQVLTSVTNVLNKVRPVGVRMNVRLPDLLPVNLKVSILLRNEKNLDRQAICRRAEIAILRYLNKMLVGTPLLYSQIIQSILDSSETILDVSILEFSANGEEVLRKNYTPGSDQQIVPGEITVIASV